MSRPPMPRGTAYAVLAALAAVVVLISAAIFIGARTGERPGAAAGEARGSASPASTGSWAGTWGTSASAAEPRTPGGFAGMSVRNVVHTSIGGTSARIQLSNLYGNQPLSLTHVSVALAAAPGDAAAEPGTMRRLTFGGRTGVTIPAGRSVVSDPVRLAVPAAADLLVTTYSPTPSGPVTYHPHARQTSYLAHGDRAEDGSGAAYTGRSPYWRYLTGVDVWNKDAQGAVAVIGDSITDGVTSTVGANHRWTDFLAARLRTEPDAPRYGVLNQGISGNRVLLGGMHGRVSANPSALSRLDRDVFARTGVRAVISQLGVNDILRLPHQKDPRRIVAGLRELVARAHAHGLPVSGTTLMPFGGHRGYDPRLEAVREAVNAEIRAGHVYDDVIDLDKALRDPAAPKRLDPRYDSGDHLHPSDAGYQAMARAVDLKSLKNASSATL
ncbi:SGNH/GDSL hydrolase family protein [Streptomyces sp. NPDC057654]|uniref:SGNH/GDSL hydrolase family protein n=1 Tax=Streptomyces sp. NPDC057654 TaxID=3346196 RepID=UPI0036C2E6E8